MNNFLPFAVSINWFAALDKFVSGAFLGLGFIVAIWAVMKITGKPKKERKPHQDVDKSFYVLLPCILVATLVFLTDGKMWSWLFALFAVSMTFFCLILHVETDFQKERLLAIQQEQNSKFNQSSTEDIDTSNLATPSLYSFYVGQTVVYIDDYMPDHTETIELIKDGYAYFNKGSRRCILEMIRPATAIEERIGERQN